MAKWGARRPAWFLRTRRGGKPRLSAHPRATAEGCTVALIVVASLDARGAFYSSLIRTRGSAAARSAFWQFLVISQYFLTEVYTDVRCEIQMTVTKERFGSASIHFSSELPRNGEASGVRTLGPSSAVAGTPQTGARDIFPSGRIVTSLQHRGAKPTGSARRPKAGFARPSPRPPRDRGAETGGNLIRAPRKDVGLLEHLRGAPHPGPRGKEARDGGVGGIEARRTARGQEGDAG